MPYYNATKPCVGGSVRGCISWGGHWTDAAKEHADKQSLFEAAKRSLCASNAVHFSSWDVPLSLRSEGAVYPPVPEPAGTTLRWQFGMEDRVQLDLDRWQWG